MEIYGRRSARVLTSLQHWLLNEQEFRRNPALGEGECELLCQSTPIKPMLTSHSHVFQR
jgi:hypothetical protein